MLSCSYTKQQKQTIHCSCRYNASDWDCSWAVIPFVVLSQMSRFVTKPTKWLCAQRRLRSAWASALSDQSLLCAQWEAKDPGFLHADSEDSDQTGRMPRLIWVLAGRTCHFVGFVRSWLRWPLHRLWCHKRKFSFNCLLLRSSAF